MESARWIDRSLGSSISRRSSLEPVSWNQSRYSLSRPSRVTSLLHTCTVDTITDTNQSRGGGKKIEVDGPRGPFVCGNGLPFAQVRPQLSRRSTNTEQTWSLLEHRIWKIIIKIIFYFILVKSIIIYKIKLFFTSIFL